MKDGNCTSCHTWKCPKPSGHQNHVGVCHIYVAVCHSSRPLCLYVGYARAEFKVLKTFLKARPLWITGVQARAAGQPQTAAIRTKGATGAAAGDQAGRQRHQVNTVDELENRGRPSPLNASRTARNGPRSPEQGHGKGSVACGPFQALPGLQRPGASSLRPCVRAVL